jgi:hypothetical protein
MHRSGVLFIPFCTILVGSVTGCDPGVRCGPGTVLRDGVCVIDEADAGVADAPSADAPPGSDVPSVDAPPTCGSGDRSICVGNDVLDCGSGARSACGTEACLVLDWTSGEREGFCAPAGSTPCDSTTFADACVGSTFRSCLFRADATRRLPGWIIETDCAGRGPDGRCETSPMPHCESTPCDASYVEVCTPDGRGTSCIDGDVVYWDCGGGYTCVPDRATGDLGCAGPFAVMSDRASATPEVVGCVGGDARFQRHGWEWTAACEPVPVRIGGEFVSVATSCVTTDGESTCALPPEHRSPCSPSGWACHPTADAMATFCDGALELHYTCASGICDPDTGRCVAPRTCDPATSDGVCTGTGLAAACVDENGDGVGFMARRGCPTSCVESPFSCP